MIADTLQFGNYALLALRLAMSAIFATHGLSKLNNWKKTPNFMRFIGVCEVLGAASMFLGFWTQISGLGLAIIMAGAAYSKKFKWNVPFSTMKGMGWEFDLSLFAIGLALAILGSGIFSIDFMLGLWP